MRNRYSIPILFVHSQHYSRAHSLLKFQTSLFSKKKNLSDNGGGSSYFVLSIFEQNNDEFIKIKKLNKLFIL